MHVKFQGNVATVGTDFERLPGSTMLACALGYTRCALLGAGCTRSKACALGCARATGGTCAYLGERATMRARASGRLCIKAHATLGA